MFRKLAADALEVSWRVVHVDHESSAIGDEIGAFSQGVERGGTGRCDWIEVVDAQLADAGEAPFFGACCRHGEILKLIESGAAALGKPARLFGGEGLG